MLLNKSTRLEYANNYGVMIKKMDGEYRLLIKKNIADFSSLIENPKYVKVPLYGIESALENARAMYPGKVALTKTKLLTDKRVRCYSIAIGDGVSGQIDEYCKDKEFDYFN